jgi:transmembrane sensor
MNSFDIDGLIIGYLSGNYTELEEKQLLTWLNSSPDNLKYFEQFEITWLASSQLKDITKVSSETAFIELSNKLLLDHKLIDYQDNKKTKNRIIGFLKYAAIIIVVFCLGIIFNRLNNKGSVKNENYSICSYEIPIGAKGKVILPDSTIVWLNAGSSLKYRTDYNKIGRTVYLKGEAYFEVKTNPLKPFIVKARELDIKALGTIFNVKAYDDDEDIVTTLVKGKVNIEGKDNLNKMFVLNMKPGQCVKFYHNKPNSELPTKQKENERDTQDKEFQNNNKLIGINKVIKMDAVKTVLFTSWKDNRWIIENESLLLLIKDLERRYNVTFNIKGEELKDYHFSGTIQNENIEQILCILSFTLPLKYNIDKNLINLSVDSNLKIKFMKAL